MPMEKQTSGNFQFKVAFCYWMVRGYQVEYISVSDRRGRAARPKNVFQSSSSFVRKAREVLYLIKRSKKFQLTHIKYQIVWSGCQEES